MNRTRLLATAFLLLSLGPVVSAADDWSDLQRTLTEYRRQLDDVRRSHGGTRGLPPVAFFLFGMGDRQKLLYHNGVLRDARSGRELRHWNVQETLIVPPSYTVALRTKTGSTVVIREDEQAVWLAENGTRTALTRGRVVLPDFADRRNPAVLRVLHQEVLINVVAGKPVPNFLVYSRPWYRDGAMMAMVLQRTGNLHLLEGWIRGLREPYDRNNGGEREADNLGQVLFLVSLVSDRSHPLVPVVRQELKRHEQGTSISGRSDFATHPVYQTRWAKLGLRALGLTDPYDVPRVADSYAALAWWSSPRETPSDRSVIASDDYPYLTWAGAHASGQAKGKLSDRDYPLTWESKASQADYRGMHIIDPIYEAQQLCTPHTWHAAEAFLDLLGARP